MLGFCVMEDQILAFVEGRPDPIHPGKILRLVARLRGLNASDIARLGCLSAHTVYDVLAERRGVSTRTSALLSAALDTHPTFWARLQKICAQKRLLG